MRRLYDSTSSEDSSTLNLTAIRLTPSQYAVARDVLRDAHAGGVCLIRGTRGIGKTTLLRWLASRITGTLLSARQGKLEQAIGTDSIVLADDAQHLSSDDLRRLSWQARVRRTTVVLASTWQESHEENEPLRAGIHRLPRLTARDLACLGREYLGESSERIDFRKVLRQVPAIDGHRLKSACLWLGLRDAEPDTNALLAYLRDRR